MPIINMIGAIPPYAFMPLFVIWFGVGEKPKLMLITLTTALPIMAAAVQGIRSVNRLHIRSLMTLGANGWQMFRHIIWKTALPYIFSGMKISAQLSFAALVVAEMIGSDVGLGFLIADGRNWFRVPQMFMAMVIIAVLSLVFQGILSFAEKKLFQWKEDGTATAVE
jgi:sulfonate transport system permease protein